MNDFEVNSYAELFEEKGEDHPSQLSLSMSLEVLNIVRQELHNVGCTLKDYRIDFTTKGFDIKNIKVNVPDPKRVVEILKQSQPEVRHEIDKSPTRYAMMVANVEIARRVNEELGLDYGAMAYPKADVVAISVQEPKEEKPLPEPPKPDTVPQDVVDAVEEPIGPDQNVEDLGIEEPMQVPPDSATPPGAPGGVPEPLEMPMDDLDIDMEPEGPGEGEDDLGGLEDEVEEPEGPRPGREY